MEIIGMIIINYNYSIKKKNIGKDEKSLPIPATLLPMLYSIIKKKNPHSGPLYFKFFGI